MAKFPFNFINDRHRELVGAEVADLKRFAQTIVDQSEVRTEVTKVEIKGFLGARKNSGDAEWARFFEANPAWERLAI